MATKQKKTKSEWKPIKAWVLADPETSYLNTQYVTDTRMGNGGRGSITEGWRPVRVEIRAVRIR